MREKIRESLKDLNELALINVCGHQDATRESTSQFARLRILRAAYVSSGEVGEIRNVTVNGFIRSTNASEWIFPRFVSVSVKQRAQALIRTFGVRVDALTPL